MLSPHESLLTQWQTEQLSQHQSLRTRWQTEQLELVQKHEEEARRLAEEARNNQLRLERDQKFELQKQQLNQWMQAESLFQKVTKEDEKGCAPIKDTQEETLDYLQHTICSVNVMFKKSNDELSEARKIGAKMVKAVDTVKARRLIEDARKSKGLGKLTRSVIRFKNVGGMDQAPWIAEFRRRFKSHERWESMMLLELSKWDGILQNPTFQPFKTVFKNDEWKQEIDHENEQLSSLKKEYGIGVYNSVTTALMELEEYNPSGRYPVPSAWNCEESRIATLKEVFSHLAPAIDALVGPLDLDELTTQFS